MSMASKSDKHDVMISYSGRNKNKKYVYKILDYFKRVGLTYWIDKEHMSGCMLEARSKAVENCSIFLMCYSKEYSESEPCKKEATFAAEQKKIIIPCRMEPDYKPTGWLGILICEKLYFDFSGKCPFKKMKDILQEIKTRLNMETLDPLMVFSKSCTTRGSDESDSDETTSTSESESEESSESSEEAQ